MSGILHPKPPNSKTTELTCFWIWRNPPHIQIEVIRARKNVLLRIKIKAVYHKVSPELHYLIVDLVSPNIKRKENEIVFLILCTSLINLSLNRDEVPAEKCCMLINGPKFKSMLRVSNAYCPKCMFSLLNKAIDYGWL